MLPVVWPNCSHFCQTLVPISAFISTTTKFRPYWLIRNSCYTWCSRNRNFITPPDKKPVTPSTVIREWVNRFKAVCSPQLAYNVADVLVRQLYSTCTQLVAVLVSMSVRVRQMLVKLQTTRAHLLKNKFLTSYGIQLTPKSGSDFTTMAVDGQGNDA